MKRLADLQQRRGKCIADARAILDKADAEKRAVTTEEDANYAKAFADAEALGKEIERETKLAEQERALKKPIAGDDDPKPNPVATDPKVDPAKKPGPRGTPEYRAAFGHWMGEGSAALTPDERRALSAGTAGAGGTLVAAEQFVAELIKTLDETVAIRNLATKIALTESDTLGAPSLDTDIEDGTWTTEVANIDEDTAMATGTRAMVPNWLAKRIKVSDRLLRISAIPVEQLVRDRLSYKLGIAQEKGFLTGSGSGQPLGVFTASASGISTARDVVCGSTTAFTADALQDVKYSLKGQYWGRPSTRWLIHRDGWKQIGKLKDTTNQYLFQPSFQLGQPDMLLGVPIIMSEFVPNTFTTGLYVGMLGDFSFYWVVDSLMVQIKRLDELYAETNQVGFIGRIELDGAPVREEPFVRCKLA